MAEVFGNIKKGDKVTLFRNRTQRDVVVTSVGRKYIITHPGQRFDVRDGSAVDGFGRIHTEETRAAALRRSEASSKLGSYRMERFITHATLEEVEQVVALVGKYNA